MLFFFPKGGRTYTGPLEAARILALSRVIYVL